jgi:Phosphoribosyl transferase (PRTase)/PELOTA RNA binding domain
VTAAFPGSYDPADVAFLLTPLELPTISVAEKETLLRTGARHYSELLSAEACPSPAYLAAFRAALAVNGARLARDIAALAAALAQRPAGPGGLAIVSFARAGTPIGVLIGRALRRAGKTAVHYSISIVRDRGIDPAALRHIAARHAPQDIVFVDGWTGKGAIAREMHRSADLAALGIAPYLVVVADPAGQADLAATGEDYLIPSGILNGIVSGLVSRSVIPVDLPPGSFHGCRVLDELAPHDLSREFVNEIDRLVRAHSGTQAAQWTRADRAARSAACARLLRRLAADYAITDINRIKPGLAEATRAVLRRQPRALLARPTDDGALDHLTVLCAERQVPMIRTDDLEGYRAVAILT